MRNRPLKMEVQTALKSNMACKVELFLSFNQSINQSMYDSSLGTACVLRSYPYCSTAQDRQQNSMAKRQGGQHATGAG